MSSTQSHHVLRLVLSCRSLKAHVTQPGTSYIVAMASSTEQEFLIQYRSKLDQFPRSRRFWDAKVASKVGEKLGFRLKEIGISSIAIDVDEEISRPFDRRRLVLPIFDSLRRAGVAIDGAERLNEIGPSQDDIKRDMLDSRSLPDFFKRNTYNSSFEDLGIAGV